MYRALTWLALRQGTDTADGEALGRLAESADIRFHQSTAGEAQRVYCRGRDVTEDIRSRPVSIAVPGVSAFADVRKAIVEIQRKLAADQDVVMEGRDIGTVVLPDAECKIYLTATVEERAKRRLKERVGPGDLSGEAGQTLEDIILELKKRDLEDSTRKISPLRRAEGSVLLDTTSLSFQEAVEEALRIVRSIQ